MIESISTVSKKWSSEKIFYISLFIIFIFVLYKIIFYSSVKEGLNHITPNEKYFKNKFKIRRHTEDIYDPFYTSIYDKIFFDHYRYNFEIKTILKHTNINKQSIVLDVGCGLGHTVRGLHPHTKNVQGIDISKNMINQAKKKIPIYYISSKQCYEQHVF